MKKIIALVVVIMAVLVGIFAVWLGKPALKGEERVTESVSEAQNRFAQVQREAENVDVNGYLSEDFLPLWKAGGDDGEAAPVKKTVADWAAFGSTKGSEIDHQALLEGRDEGYLAARGAFEAILPNLVTTLNRRLFVVPRPNLSSFQNPDGNGVRLLGQAVYSYVESKVAEGKPEQAVPALAALFSLGGNMQGRETLVNDLMGISLQRTAFKALGALKGDSTLSSEDWLLLATAVQHGIPPIDQMTRAFQAEICVSLEHIQHNEEAAEESGSYLDRKFLEREKRIFMNQTALQLSAMKHGSLADYTEPEPSFGASMTGETGTIALIRTSDFLRADAIMDFHRRSMILTAAALDLRAYRAKNGKLPDSLDKLSEMGLPAPQETLEYDPQKKTVSIIVPPDVLKKVDAKDFTFPGWSEVTETGLRLSL